MATIEERLAAIEAQLVSEAPIIAETSAQVDAEEPVIAGTAATTTTLLSRVQTLEAEVVALKQRLDADVPAIAWLRKWLSTMGARPNGGV